MRVPRRTLPVLTALLAAAGFTGLLGFTRGPLVLGPGAGARTAEPAMVRPLRADVSVTPIITVGDTLAGLDTVTVPYVFPPLPDGLGIQRGTVPGVAEVFVTHEIVWDGIDGGSQVSRLALDVRNMGILAADRPIDGTEGYSRLCAATLTGPGRGFLSPKFLVNEEWIEGPYRGIVAAVDARDGSVTNLPWLGRFSHETTEIVPVSSGKLVAILTEDYYPGESQLYMYVADNDAAFLAGRGRLHVFRANPVPGRPNTRLASMATKSRSLTGSFVPLTIERGPDPAIPARLEAQVQSLGALNFVRLEDAVADQTEPNAVYFADTGSNELRDPTTGRAVTGGGRIYHMRLDPFDPTRVQELRVELDADEGDDLYRPDNLEMDDRYLWIQEDPGGSRGLHTARILRYDTHGRRIEPMAECAERDPRRGELLPQGVGGVWETTGIVSASDLFGPDTWLIAVQAPNMPMPAFRRRLGSGQLLLLRGPNARRAEPRRESSPPPESTKRPGGCG